jgi:hypothetical protein
VPTPLERIALIWATALVAIVFLLQNPLMPGDVHLTFGPVCPEPANTPGGADPWGGCWPGAHNTGYPQGLPGDNRTPVTLTEYTGPDTITSCGTTIDSKIINSWIAVTAGNGTHSPDTPCVTVTNSLINGTIRTDTNADGPLLIEDTELDTHDEAMDVGIPFIENLGRYNVFAYRVNSHGGDPTIKCEEYCVTKDSWTHAGTLGGTDRHYNAIGSNGIAAGTWNIEHNSASCGDWEDENTTTDPANGDAGCSSDIGFYGDFYAVQNITIHRNLLRGATDNAFTNESGNQPAYCLNPGYYVGKPFPQPINMTITDNVFGRSGDFGSNCGTAGTSNSVEDDADPEATVTWSGNQFTDGTTVARPQE